jgi:hypothetical protein
VLLCKEQRIKDEGKRRKEKGLRITEIGMLE